MKSVTIGNSVTDISEKAFQSCSSLTSVTIPNSVTIIREYAFYSCINLKSVTIGSDLTWIADKAFAYCSDLEDIYCLAQNVPLSPYGSNSELFKNSLIEYATLYVPASLIEQYIATDPWSGFGTITALTDDEIDGIKEVEHSPLNIEHSAEGLYDLSGRKLDKPTKGINIIRMSDGTIRKTLMK